MSFSTMQSTCEEHNRCVVVYTCAKCPFCESEENLKVAEKDLESMTDERNDAQSRVDELEAEVAQYEKIADRRFDSSEGRLFKEEE